MVWSGKRITSNSSGKYQNLVRQQQGPSDLLLFYFYGPRLPATGNDYRVKLAIAPAGSQATEVFCGSSAPAMKWSGVPIIPSVFAKGNSQRVGVDPKPKRRHQTTSRTL